jgi:hypothetical protein
LALLKLSVFILFGGHDGGSHLIFGDLLLGGGVTAILAKLSHRALFE